MLRVSRWADIHCRMTPARRTGPTRVPQRVAKLHPCVAETKRTISERSPGLDGRIAAWDGPGPTVVVSRSNIGRTLRILHTIFTAAEARGWTIRARQGRGPWDRNAGAVIAIGDHDCEVRVAEATSRVAIAPD